MSFFGVREPPSRAEADDAASVAAVAAAAEAAQRRFDDTLRRGGELEILRQEMSMRADAARSRLHERRRAEGQAVLTQLRGLECQGAGTVAVTAVDAEEDVVSEIDVVAAPVKSYAVRHGRVLLPPARTAGGSGGSSSGASTYSSPSRGTFLQSKTGGGAAGASPSRRMVTDASTLRRVKFLQFYDDHRPAYYGTRRRKGAGKQGGKGGRKSKGRNPVNSVGTLSGVDYEVDSEEEWEEGAEEGESLSGSEGEDEGADGRELDYGDGWLCEDDQIEYKDGKMQDELNAEGGKRKRIKAGGPRAAAKVIVGPLRLLTDGALCMANGLDVDVAAVEAAAMAEQAEWEAKVAEREAKAAAAAEAVANGGTAAETASGETKEIEAPVVEEASFGGGNIGASLMHTINGSDKSTSSSSKSSSSSSSSSSSFSSSSSSSSSSASSAYASSASSSSSSSSSLPKRARTGEAGGEDSSTPVKNIPMLRGVDGLAGAARLFQQYAAVSLVGDGQAPLQVLHRAEMHDDATFAQRMMESRGTKRAAPGGDDKRGVGAAKKVVPPELLKELALLLDGAESRKKVEEAFLATHGEVVSKVQVQKKVTAMGVRERRGTLEIDAVELQKVKWFVNSAMREELGLDAPPSLLPSVAEVKAAKAAARTKKTVKAGFSLLSWLRKPRF